MDKNKIIIEYLKNKLSEIQLDIEKTQKEYPIENTRVSIAKRRSLQFRVAESRVKSGRASCAELQSLQCRVAKYPVQSGNVSSAEWHCL